MSRFTTKLKVGVLTLPTTCLLNPTLYALLDHPVIALVPFIPITQSACVLAKAESFNPLKAVSGWIEVKAFEIPSLVID